MSRPASECRANVVVADRLAFLALVLAAIAAGIGVTVSGLYRDTPEMVRQAHAADLVTLAVAVPILGFGLAGARAGSPNARMVTLGTVGYLAYSYAIYAFSVVINPLTPLHLAILGLTSWSFVFFVAGIDTSTLSAAGRGRLPRRTTATFLLVVASLFAVLWLGQITGAITSGRLPVSITDLALPSNPVYALDLAFALPLLALTGVWLLRGDARGRAATLAALTFTALMGLSVLAIFVVDAEAGVTVDAAPIILVALVTATAATLVILPLVTSPRGPHGDRGAGPTQPSSLGSAAEPPPLRPSMTNGSATPLRRRPGSARSITGAGSATRGK